jgi:hypothetical protein
MLSMAAMLQAVHYEDSLKICRWKYASLGDNFLLKNTRSWMDA